MTMSDLARQAPTNVLLASAGRRPYLVEWFIEAYKNCGLNGRVILADADPLAAAQRLADDFVVAPSASESRYADWLADVLEQYEISLALSVNDFELSQWSQLEGERYERLVSLDKGTQLIVEDKYLMAQHLTVSGIVTPGTSLASDADRMRSHGDSVVVKGRFGSGSRGLWIGPVADLEASIARGRQEVTDGSGRSPDGQTHADELIVIQPKIAGVEYGLDVIADLDGRHSGVLARRKVSMRAGETEKAVTADAGRFENLARRITAAVPHPGLIDVDVIEDSDGRLWTIDINPRFGGGYPFSHVAGADVPAAYLAWAAHKDVEPGWLKATTGISAAKHVGISAVGRETLT